MVSFSVDLEDFNWRLRVEAAPRVPRARMPRVEVGSGIILLASTPNDTDSHVKVAGWVEVILTSK